jgi:hypothetical protein
VNRIKPVKTGEPAVLKTDGLLAFFFFFFHRPEKDFVSIFFEKIKIKQKIETITEI